MKSLLSKKNFFPVLFSVPFGTFIVAREKEKKKVLTEKLRRTPSVVSLLN